MRATILSVFSITGRGPVLSVEILEGTVKIGDRILCPMTSHDARALTVLGVESIRSPELHSQGKHPVGLLVGPLEPGEVSVGGEIVSES